MTVMNQRNEVVKLPSDIVDALKLMPENAGVTYRGQGYTVIRKSRDNIYVKQETL